MKKQEIKPFAWGAVVGAVALPIVMFSAGWVVTSGAAETNATTMSRSAVVESLASICVAQFQDAANREENLSKLIATNSWARSNYVSDKGWATMPGSDAPASKVAAACAARLAKLQN